MTMSLWKWISGIRMFMGFIVAPALVPIWSISLFAVFIDSREIDCPAGLASFIEGIPAAIVMWYVCIVGLGLPWVLSTRSRGELCLWRMMAPILCLACPLAVLFLVLGAMGGLLIGVIAALWLPVVVLSALCFYFIGVWQPAGWAQEGL